MDISKNGFRLPSEAEWEWAAKGGVESRWAGSDDEEEVDRYMWHDGNSENRTHEVKKLKPNGYGLYDMSGNVWEWCWDRFKDFLPDSLVEAGVVDIDDIPDSCRVFRGGGIISIYITQRCRSGSFILPIFMQVVSDYVWHAGCNFCIFRIAYHTARKNPKAGNIFFKALVASAFEHYVGKDSANGISQWCKPCIPHKKPKYAENNTHNRHHTEMFRLC